MVLWFWLSFVSTVAALVGVLVTGLRRRRRQHFTFAVAFIVLLAVTIWLTESLMRSVEFPREELDFHLKFAMSATFLLLPVVVSGLMLARRGGRVVRWIHRIAVVVFVVAVLLATATGIWVFSLAT